MLPRGYPSLWEADPAGRASVNWSTDCDDRGPFLGTLYGMSLAPALTCLAGKPLSLGAALTCMLTPRGHTLAPPPLPELHSLALCIREVHEADLEVLRQLGQLARSHVDVHKNAAQNRGAYRGLPFIYCR